MDGLSRYRDDDIPVPFDPLTDVPEDTNILLKTLQPYFEETVELTSPGHWSIGSLMLCEKVEEGQKVPSDVVCSWSDEGKTYCIRKRPTPRITIDGEPKGDILTGRVSRGYNAALWMLSPNVFCKVKSWAEGLTTEASTIRFVNKHVPSIPTEEIICEWIDQKWKRTVMLSRRVAGTRYNEAWPRLTIIQRLQVAHEVAGHFKELAKHESDYVETVSGGAIAGQYSLRIRETLPAWKPRIESRVSQEDHFEYLKRQDEGIEPLDADDPFVLQHVDCGPKHFFVTIPTDPLEAPKVTAIMYWEGAGYLPKWRVATEPRLNRNFAIYTPPILQDSTIVYPTPPKDFADWMWMLSHACVRAGFPLYTSYMMRQGRRALRQYPAARIEFAVSTTNLPGAQVAQGAEAAGAEAAPELLLLPLLRRFLSI
ncbi:uncharacterized protein BP5553_05000 [Venustampulla echinocandica]|uniref:Aminoglycoside phosphotransferase domain-containing protein n=1 Tax=Venustampulla echinocandica TaxID=2656787 RepID=A0A370TPV4_9HELO|nr:uncharacterized protein BP5553_05000 [Venustampulla echinocandica]RDL37567.1 hypothetical protein BP5553_05000 [Venustampulla echinocandica]